MPVELGVSYTESRATQRRSNGRSLGSAVKISVLGRGIGLLYSEQHQDGAENVCSPALVLVVVVPAYLLHVYQVQRLERAPRSFSVREY